MQIAKKCMKGLGSLILLVLLGSLLACQAAATPDATIEVSTGSGETYTANGCLVIPDAENVGIEDGKCVYKNISDQSKFVGDAPSGFGATATATVISPTGTSTPNPGTADSTPSVPASTSTPVPVVVEPRAVGGGLPEIVYEFLGRPDFPQTSINDVPGGTYDPAGQPKPPEAWVPLNGADPDIWGVPYVLQGVPPYRADGVSYNSHHSWELAPGKVYTAQWVLSSFAYENGSLGKTITHNTWLQLMWVWGAADTSSQLHDGVAIWGPSTNAPMKVVYHLDSGDQTCTGTSVELIPGVVFDLHQENLGTTGAVYSIGAWGIRSDHGKNPPECRPNLPSSWSGFPVLPSP